MKSLFKILLMAAIAATFAIVGYSHGHKIGIRDERIAARFDTACSFAHWEDGNSEQAITEKVSVSYDHRAAFVQVGDSKIRITAESDGKLRAELKVQKEGAQ